MEEGGREGPRTRNRGSGTVREGRRVRLSERVTESERVRVTVTSVENIESK